MSAAETGYRRQVAPQPAARRPAPSPEAFGAGLGAQLQETAQAVHHEALQDYQIQREATRDEQWTGFLAGYAQHQLTMADDARERRKLAGPGYAAAMAERWDEAGHKLTEGLTEDGVRRRAQQMLAEGRARFVDGEATYEEARRVDKTTGDYLDQLNVSANLTRRLEKPDEYLAQARLQAQAIDGLDVGDDVKDKLHHEAQQTLGVAYIDGTIERDPTLAKAMLGSGAFDDVLTPKQVEALSNKADVEIHARDVAARTQAAMAKSAVSDDVSLAVKQIGDGVEWKDDDLAALRQRAAAAGIGDARLADLDDAIAANRVNREFRAAGPEAIGAEIARLDTELAGQGKDDPALVYRRNHLVKLRDTRRAQIAGDQLGWAAQNGFAVAPFVDSNPSPADVQARVRAVDAAAASAGVPPKYLSDDERKRFAAEAAAGHAGALEVLAFASKFGPQKGLAVAREIKPNDEVFAWLTVLPQETRALALTGREALKGNPKLLSYSKTDNPELAEKSDLQDRQFAAATVGMDERQRQAVRLTYGDLLAGFVSQGHPLDAKMRWRAINQAMGATGIPGANQRGGIVLWNGADETSAYALPQGMTGAEFKGRVQAKWAQNGPVNPDGSPASLAAAFPRRIGPTQYSFVSRSGQPFRRKDKSLFVVDVGRGR